MQNHLQSWHKVTNIGYHYDVSITITGHVFNYFYVLEESEVVAWKSFIKKVFLNIPQNLQENICAGVSFTKKLQAEDSNFIKY